MIAAASELNGCIAQNPQVVTAKAVQIGHYISHAGRNLTLELGHLVSGVNGGKSWDSICRGSLSTGSTKMRCTQLSIWQLPTKHLTRMIWVPATCLWRELLSSPAGARYSRDTRWSWMRPWGRRRRGLRGCRRNPDASRVWSWSMRWSHTQASGKMAATLGKFDMTPVKGDSIWKLAGICLLHSQAS